MLLDGKSLELLLMLLRLESSRLHSPLALSMLGTKVVPPLFQGIETHAELQAQPLHGLSTHLVHGLSL